MATILPDNPASQLDFFKVHAPVWVRESVAVGLSDVLAAEVVAATERAEAALEAAGQARLAALTATYAWEQAAAALSDVGRRAIATIKTHARATKPETVYAAALISGPARPGPKSRTPGEAVAALPRVRWCVARPTEYGTVEVEWTCGRGATMGAGSGMIYRVERALDNGPFQLFEVIGSPGAGRRSVTFIDRTVPAGTRGVQYRVSPMRGGATGHSGPIATVQFGMSRESMAGVSAAARLAA